MPDRKNIIGRRIRKLRKEEGLSLRELAEKLNISFSLLGMYERGERQPPIDKLEMISDYFNIDIGYFLNKNNNPADKIKQAISNDPELLQFWDKLKERKDLQLMFKQTKDLPPETIKQIIDIIKTFEREQDEKYNG